MRPCDTHWYAPFTDDQIRLLNWWQGAGVFHEYTCGTEGCRAALIPTHNGWICPDCKYTQNWALAIRPGDEHGAKGNQVWR